MAPSNDLYPSSEHRECSYYQPVLSFQKLFTFQFSFYIYFGKMHYIYSALYIYIYTGLFEMIVGVLTTCHTQYT